MTPGIILAKGLGMAGSRCGLNLVAVFLVSGCCLPLLAQQTEPKRTQERSSPSLRQQAGQSELEKENAD